MDKAQKPRAKRLAICGGKYEPFIKAKCARRTCSLLQYDIGEMGSAPSDEVLIADPNHAREVADYLTRWANWVEGRDAV